MTALRGSERHLDALADEADKMLRAELRPSVEAQAKSELPDECNQPGTAVALAWLEFRSECREISAREFIGELESVGADLFVSRRDEIYHLFLEGMRDQ